MRYWYWLSILTPLWNILGLLLTVQHSCLVRYWSMEWWGSAVWDIDSSVSYCQTLWSPVKYTWLHRSCCAWLNESNPGQGKLYKVGWWLDCVTFLSYSASEKTCKSVTCHCYGSLSVVVKMHLCMAICICIWQIFLPLNICQGVTHTVVSSVDSFSSKLFVYVIVCCIYCNGIVF